MATTELLVGATAHGTAAALVAEDRLLEFHLDDSAAPRDVPRHGRIVKARVSRVLAGIQAAFVELGDGHHGFLRSADLRLPGERAAAAGRRLPIQDRLKAGRDLLVQVVREPIGNKVARVSCRLTLPGRFLVLCPGASRCSVSRRIRNADERRRLLGRVGELAPEGAGFVVRTAASGVEVGELQAEARELVDRWKRVRLAAEGGPPRVVLREPEFLDRVLSDLSAEPLERVVVEDEDLRQRVLGRLAVIGPVGTLPVEPHRGGEPLLRTRGVIGEVLAALQPRVPLPGGGALVIESTEALISVDVDSAGDSGGLDPEETAVRINSEAVEECSRQLRLRELGGTVVLDCVEMESEGARRRILDLARVAFRRDRARVRLVGMSESGLLELTRSRTGPGLSDRLTVGCPRCGGAGRLLPGPAEL